MAKLSGKKISMTERVNIVTYNPEWPRRFAEESEVLGTVFTGSNVAIEHIGSTSVIGLGAKPIIDIMIGLERLADAETRIAALEALDYEYVPEYESEMPDRRYFRKPRLGPRAYHVHCVVKDSSFWVRHLAFRNHLRAHPESARAYEELKRSLAIRLGKDEYTDAKTPFIEGILATVIRG
jgi:GrpB-like predicted nucleotidyltransferase (UPF0157 family)